MPPTPPATAAADRRRAACFAELALGTDRFHAPRRADCPWCGSARLLTRFTAPDLLQHKPGTFMLDECRDCGHTFLNPPLSPEGLAFHHRYPDDARPGRRRLRAAARALLPFPEPESWLDVGTGDAHFPQAARELFPYTAFDGVDPTHRVLRAREAGRIEEAYVGHLAAPDLTARLRVRYDVVSLLHQLDRTPAPRAELRAAVTALRPGGHLLLEAPDPQCAFARLFGKWWLPHTLPRHLHLIPLDNLRRELESHGCTIVTVDHRPAHRPHDLSTALSLAVSHVLPAPDTPWRPIAPTPLQQTVRTTFRCAALPLTAAAGAADHTLAPLLRRTRFANAYRIIARRT
ncbi:class I SAM-dependent methyltransferase [Streptomyces sp. HC307]|uniref:class I SAM-dependent methyltransferase n=1 Tax=Streptomyces flavusporus TaxID=3385496 RepID=UPI00391731BE